MSSVQTCFTVLLPTTIARDEFAGFLVTCRGDFFRLTLACAPDAGRVDPTSVAVDPALENLLGPFKASLLARARDACNLDAFMIELSDLAASALRAEARDTSGLAPERAVPAAFYEMLIGELERVGWERLVDLDAEARRVTLQATDARGRRHELGLYLPPDFPQSPPELSADLPAPLVPRPSGRTFSLAGVVRQWEAKLEEYQGHWTHLDDLDANTWILEPEVPPEVQSQAKGQAGGAQAGGQVPRGALHRRLAVAPHASALFQLDPSRPHALPPTGLRFLGREATVAPLRARFNQAMTVQGTWDSSGDTTLRANLERCLGVTLPCPKRCLGAEDEDGHGFRAECAICYAYRLNPESADGAQGAIPETVCTNPKCSRSYHTLCLSEWLRALPSSSRSFETIFGQCPYCFVPISVRAGS